MIEDFDITSYVNDETSYVNGYNMDRIVKSFAEASS